jgi:hypothetical protein
MANNTATPENQVFSQNREYRQHTPVHLTDPRGGQSAKQQDTATQAQPTPSQEASQAPKTDPEDTVDWKKRHADLRSHATKRETELGEQLKIALEQLTQEKNAIKALKEAQANQSLLTDEQLKLLSEEYPEFDKLARTRAYQAHDPKVSELESKVKELESKLTTSHVEKARNELAALHPDFTSIEKSTEFKDWAEEQPTGIRNLFASSDIRDIARGLDIYKAEKGLDNKSQKKKELEKTMAVKTEEPPIRPEGRQERLWTTSEIKALNPNAKDFAEKMAEVNQAAREGRVVKG